MAIDRATKYPGRFDNPTGTRPQGAFKNRTTDTSKDGSYLEKDWLNDIDGFFASALIAAGITPNGLVDEGGASQLFDAVKQSILTTAGGVNVLYNTGHSAVYFPVNQRSFDGNWGALSIGDYGYDGWLKYSATHKAQIIELGDFEDIDYTISYDGASAGTIRPPNGVGEPWLVAVPFAVDKIDLRPSEGFGYWQAEDVAAKIAKSQRHYDITAANLASSTVDGLARVVWFYAQPMRKLPTQYPASGSVFTGSEQATKKFITYYQTGTAITAILAVGSVADASFAIADAGTNITEVN